MFGFDLKDLPGILIPKVMVPLLLATSLLLFSDQELLSKFGVDVFVDAYRTWIGPAWIVSASVLATTAGAWLIAWIRAIARTRQCRNNRTKLLDDLTAPECYILAHFIDRRTKTVKLDISDGVVNGLKAKSILFVASSIGRVGRGGGADIDCNIADWAYDHLMKHKEKLEEKLQDWEPPRRSIWW